MASYTWGGDEDNYICRLLLVYLARCGLELMRLSSTEIDASLAGVHDPEPETCVFVVVTEQVT